MNFFCESLRALCDVGSFSQYSSPKYLQVTENLSAVMKVLAMEDAFDHKTETRNDREKLVTKGYTGLSVHFLS